MSSGIYSALSGAISRLERMDTISDNLSNANTIGFKKGQNVFEPILEAARVSSSQEKGIDFARLIGGFTDFSQGTLTRTNVPLNLAIEGDGYFKVKDGEGNFSYTRQGNFRLNQDGVLMTGDGFLVMDDRNRPITLADADVMIDEQGNVDMGNGQIVKLPLYRFDRTSDIVREGGGRFVPKSGTDPILVENPRIYQGQLEESNVSMMQEMGKMMDNMRVFEACQKMLKTFNKIADKTNEIGII